MKYIDTDKLIALLEQRKKQLVQWMDKEYANQRIDEIDCILDVDIASLQQERPVLHGWVAREDKGRLLLFGEKPLRNGNYGWKSSSFCIELNSNLYPDLMWIDDPIEVELSINKI
jgi:hypothetical protein